MRETEGVDCVRNNRKGRARDMGKVKMYCFYKEESCCFVAAYLRVTYWNVEGTFPLIPSTYLQGNALQLFYFAWIMKYLPGVRLELTSDTFP